jgi:alcohol dehydrogenase class IV
MTITRFSFPTTIHFGPGARRLAGPHLRDQGLKRVLLVTDQGLAALPLIAGVKAELEEAGLAVAVFGGIWGNPTSSQVASGAAAFEAHGADGVVGVGGGAALDVAKVIGLVANHPGDVIRFAWDHPQARPIEGALPYFVALPTTAGTGSEVGRSSVISEEVSHVKRVIFSPLLLARAVFADPELTLGLPPALTAATGMDALTHNVESYLSPAYHPLCDGIALEGTRIASRALLTAVRQPGNLQARADMMMCSMMGAIAFQKDLGAVHSCAHALGTVCDLHHGLANALMIDTVLAWNLEAVPDRFDELAHAAGLAGGGAAFLPWLRTLKGSLGIPASLSAAGVRREQVARLVEVASADVCHQTNPRPCVAADFERLFLQAL